ncbi:MAG: hemerythrin domain-containing protein [Bdellovibrionales bacterium]|nr:hemerythrin domain-containing protein [Bdellovibrionales bacterium]
MYNLDANNIFEQMAEEHRAISAMVDVFDKFIYQIQRGKSKIDVHDLQDVMYFFKFFVDQYHHAKEEQILFPAADKQSVVTKQGGPRCGFFFGMYLEQGHLSEVLLDVKACSVAIPKYTPNPAIKSLLHENNPLSIPLSEHEVGYYSMQLMGIELKKFQDDPSYNLDFFAKVASRYSEMLKKHIRKEDECLFVTLRKTFPAELSKSLLQDFQNFNSQHFNERSACLEKLDQLRIKS